MNVVIDEGQRQMIALALAELSLSRPGWDVALGVIAEAISASDMYEQFKVTSNLESELTGL